MVDFIYFFIGALIGSLIITSVSAFLLWRKLAKLQIEFYKNGGADYAIKNAKAQQKAIFELRNKEREKSMESRYTFLKHKNKMNFTLDDLEAKEYEYLQFHFRDSANFGPTIKTHST